MVGWGTGEGGGEGGGEGRGEGGGERGEGRGGRRGEGGRGVQQRAKEITKPMQEIKHIRQSTSHHFPSQSGVNLLVLMHLRSFYS